MSLARPGDPAPRPSRSRDLVDLVRQATSVARRDGWREVAGGLLARGSARLLTPQPFRTAARLSDVLAPIPPPAPTVGVPAEGERLCLNWVTNPPVERSGGMGTLLRAIELLEDRGHTCRIYVLYKGSRRRVDRDRAATRASHPRLRVEIHDLDEGMAPADGVVATSWPTAWAVRASGAAGARFYFVQDFEPWFYPAGSNAVLAEETYRFGFHGVTAGPWLAQKLQRDHGMPADHFELGVDLECYRLAEEGPRRGVVFFARPDTARRGFELGMMALELLARQHPDVEIHTIGQPLRWRRPTFRVTDHGHLPPAQLAALYRRCSAALVLSLSNLSLLPAELLACGCIPVMNDAEFTRGSCESPFARFAAARPDSLASALGEVLREEPGIDVRRAAASSVRSRSWDGVGAQIEAAFRSGLSDSRSD